MQHPIYNPATGKVIGEVRFANPAEIDQAVANAKQAYLQWSQVPPLKRTRVFFKFKTILENNIDRLAAIVTAEHGKTLEDARGSVMRGIELVEFICGMPYMLKGSYSENVAANVDCYTFRQALGVCVGVTPFNFPVMVPVWMFAPAIACGNSFILKPSEQDPGAPMLLQELLLEAGLPEGVLQVINGDKTAVQQLITHSDVVAASCVGSTAVAESIYQTAIQHGKRAHAFGGAKNHCIVMPDANLDEAAKALVAAGFGSAGERCMAISVVLAVGDVAEPLLERIQQQMSALKVLPGDHTDADLGPLISAEHKQRVLGLIERGIAQGARLLVDGRDCQPKGFENGYFVGPCLFDAVRPEMEIYQQEIFGPVLAVLRVDNLEAALALINQHRYGNGVAIFTQNGAAAREFASRVQVGMVGINVPIPVPIAYHSFGGWKQSVFGDIAMHAEESLRFYTKPKSVTSRWFTDASTESLSMPTH